MFFYAARVMTYTTAFLVIFVECFKAFLFNYIPFAYPHVELGGRFLFLTGTLIILISIRSAIVFFLALAFYLWAAYSAIWMYFQIHLSLITASNVFGVHLSLFWDYCEWKWEIDLGLLSYYSYRWTHCLYFFLFISSFTQEGLKFYRLDKTIFYPYLKKNPFF
jgi:hypothetical protein